MGFTTVVEDVRELNKVEIGQALATVQFQPDASAIKKWEAEGGVIDGETLEQWAHRYQTVELANWVRSMIRRGKEHFSISQVPAMFRKHVRDFMQATGEQPATDPGLPYILVIADDNIESGTSMRDAASALAAHAHVKPIITVGVALINLSTSSTTGAPRR